MGTILLLSSLPAAAECLRRALHREAAGGAVHSLRTAGGWAELAALAAAQAGPSAAFADPYHGGRLVPGNLLHLRERAPAVELVALSDFSGRPAADAFALAGLGVREVICVGGGGAVDAVVRALHAHLNRGPLDALAEELGGAVPPHVHRWLRPFLVSPGGARTVPELARAARCSPKTLRRALRVAGLPSPERLLAWRRLLHAARLLDDGRSADCAARVLEFSSGSALRKSLKHLTGLRPGELRAGGGLAWLAERFLERCGGGVGAGR
ncbi:MAG TPA: helix-turn-helix domain-containing protein [Longimicrobium sp.]|nr:helix-turn-helix domain-containing protein [Longimicrobium sp.]